MDLDFLLDEVMTDVIPLDWDAVIKSQLPLKVVASSLTTLRSEVLTGFRDRSDLVECLKASANVPEIVGGPRSHRGTSWWMRLCLSHCLSRLHSGGAVLVAL